MKVKKPQSKGAKAVSVEKVTVDRLITRLDHTTFIPEQQPYHSLLQIYKKQFLDMSVSKGLINTDSLSVADDCTPIVTSHRMRSNRICFCHKNGISEILMKNMASKSNIKMTLPSVKMVKQFILP